MRFAGAVMLLGLSTTAVEAVPLQYLSGASDKAQPVVWLTWGVLVVSVAVIIIIGLLLAAAIWHRPGLRMGIGERTALGGEAGGLNWLWIGVSLSALVLLVTVVWTVLVLADIQVPASKPAVTIEVTGKQWWWQVRYMSDDPAQSFTTANEIHIPVGVPVRLKLIGGDVIHSFWVPQLAGKMDAIPGQINETWIDARAPGTYDGQCTEYCGVQHAKMLLRVVAQTPQDFRTWWSHQLSAPNGTSDASEFLGHCGNCHAVRGTQAKGSFGPDLSHLMQRQTLASASMPNDEVTLSRWIANPQELKPGNRMPAIKLSAQEHAQIMTYLKALQ
jgi:cytochrome c oxidase subunit 2